MCRTYHEQLQGPLLDPPSSASYIEYHTFQGLTDRAWCESCGVARKRKYDRLPCEVL